MAKRIPGHKQEEVSLPGYIGYSSASDCAMPECDAAPCSIDVHPPGRPCVAVYVRAALPHARVPTDHLCSAMIECVAVTVRVHGTNTSVASVYVRAGARRADYSFVVRLTALLSPDTVVCSDFNAHHRDWGSARSNARGGDLSSAVAAAGLTVRDGVATLIDLALVSECCSYSWQRGPDTAGSDHYPITLCPTKPSRGATRVYAVVRWPLFREMCARPSRCSDYFAHIAERHARQLRRRSLAGLCSSLARPRNQHRGWRVLNALLNPRTPRFPVLAIAVAHGISELAMAMPRSCCSWDVQSAFDSLPHDTIISAVRALGVGGRLLAYVRAFLTDRVLYAFPLCNLRLHLWRRIDGDHRRVLRICHGLPSASRVVETLAETGAWPVSLTPDLRALGHLERLSSAPGAGPMLSYLLELPKSRLFLETPR
ncbi:hypothetical protein HPB49_017591 [Dermacentor silvarum]|uniref:Uncharacterized protein n=1 Tax=Dermacentor silvarum TaxID=543639 RepID=A0ACB8D742_DERSI|nr:hypothetical protein HPB49_017591 [Dermacentor silvarum]